MHDTDPPAFPTSSLGNFIPEKIIIFTITIIKANCDSLYLM